MRNISGMYVRSRVNDKWDNVCFEELPENEQSAFFNSLSDAGKWRCVRKLAEVINDLSSQFDISSEVLW